MPTAEIKGDSLLGMFLSGCLLVGLLIASLGGLAATAWVCEKIADYIYRHGRCSVAFVEFLVWKRNKARKCQEEQNANG